MHMHTKYVTELYKHLLADIRDRTEYLNWGAPVDISYEWLLIEGPKLDKQVLGYIEGREDYSNIVVPEWIKPLWDAFVAKHESSDWDSYCDSFGKAPLLRYLRQLLVFVYKAEHEPTNEQLESAQAEFEETDRSLRVWNSSFSSRNPSPCLRTARQYVGKVIYRINWSEITPKHGPGGIFPSRLPSEKSNFLTYYPTIAAVYPYDQYLWCLPSFWEDIMVGRGSKISETSDIVAKLTAVPKDSRGPRLICVHPAEAIWIQQGQRKLLEAAIKKSPLTRGKINFTDQTVNGHLALKSSRTLEYVTLDLKEASDRISTTLVRHLFGDYAADMMSCSRASSIQLLDGRVITLEKWAPMGNCLTFPVQSLIFYSLVRAGIRCRYGENCSDIYVFGDDIIFPSKYYDGALQGLLEAGLIVNSNKTFKDGFFRESCGVDAYHGIDVTPLRVKKWDTSRLDAIMSLLDLAHRCRDEWYHGVADYIYDTCRRALWTKWKVILPYGTTREHGGLFEYVPDISLRLLKKLTKVRNNRKLQRLESRTLHVRAAVSAVQMGDWYHLMDSINRLHNAGPCEDHVSDVEIGILKNSWAFKAQGYLGGTKYPIPYRTRLQYGWTPQPLS